MPFFIQLAFDTNTVVGYLIHIRASSGKFSSLPRGTKMRTSNLVTEVLTLTPNQGAHVTSRRGSNSNNAHSINKEGEKYCQQHGTPSFKRLIHPFY